MNIHVKSVVWTGCKSDDPDWIFYNTGEYKNPVMILHDGWFKALIDEYLNYHNLELKEKEIK